MPGNVTIPQPGVPYVRIWMGDEEVTFGPDRRLMEFSYSMVMSKVGEFTIKLIDSEWTVVESLLHQYWNEGIRIQYGWLGAKSGKLWTDHTITMTAQKFNPVVYDSHVEITINGFTKMSSLASAKDVYHQIKHSYVIRQTSVSQIIEKIFKEKGMLVTADQTAEFARVHSDPHSTLTVHPTFLMTGQSALQMFLNEWQCRSIEPDYNGHSNDKIVEELNGYVKGSENTGRGGFQLYFIDSDPPQVVLLRPPTKNDISSPNSFATYDYPTQHKGAREVLSFRYEVDISANSTEGLATQRSTFVDSNSKLTSTIRVQEQVIEDGPVRNSGTGQEKRSIEKNPRIPDGYTTAARYLQQFSVGRSPKEVQQFLQGYYWTKELMTRTATLELLGRPDYRLGHYVWMNVWANRRDKSTNKVIVEPHYTTGKWRVEEIHQNIRPGIFTTTLGLKKFSGIFSTPQTGIKYNKNEKNTFNRGNQGLINPISPEWMTDDKKSQ